MLRDAFKAYIRGRIIAYAAHKQKSRTQQLTEVGVVQIIKAYAAHTLSRASQANHIGKNAKLIKTCSAKAEVALTQHKMNILGRERMNR